VISSAVPGADQAVMMGALNQRLRKIPETAAPIEIAQTQDEIISFETSALCAA